MSAFPQKGLVRAVRGAFASAVLMSALTATTAMAGDATLIDFGASPKASQAVTVNGNTVTIVQGGIYRLSGKADGSQLVVNCGDQPLTLIFDNLQLTSGAGAAIDIRAAGDVEIQLAAGSDNLLADVKGSNLPAGSDANATLYSKADLKITGAENARLAVIGEREDAIVSKDDLDIRELELAIDAADEGIRGKDSVDIRDSRISIQAGGDAIKSDNTENEEKGFVHVEGSRLMIKAGDDGIQGVRAVDIIDSRIRIEESNEGIEGRFITFHSGQIYVVSKDDAVNVSEKKAASKEEEGLGSKLSSMWQGRGKGGGGHGKAIDGKVTIINADIFLKSGGDGLDSNGHAEMQGGRLIVDGPLSRGDGYIDVDGDFKLSGGYLLATGSSGMAQTPSDTSTQPIIQVNLDTPITAGQHFKVIGTDGTVVLDYPAPADFQSLTLSAPELKLEHTYKVMIDDQPVTDLTLASLITRHGEAGRGGPRGDRGKKPWWDFSSKDRPPRDGERPPHDDDHHQDS